MKTKTYTRQQWEEEGRRLFGSDEKQWLFVCPSCGHVAKVLDWVNAGSSAAMAIAFSCIGRFNGKGDDKKTFRKKGGPCMYAGGGLFAINPVKITNENQKDLYVLILRNQNDKPHRHRRESSVKHGQ